MLKRILIAILLIAIAALLYRKGPYLEGFISMNDWCKKAADFCKDQYNNKYYKDEAKYLNCLDFYKNRNVPGCADLIQMK